MNLIQPKKKKESDDVWKTVVEFRKTDYQSFIDTLHEYFDNFKKLSPEFDFKLNLINKPSHYLASNESLMTLIQINAKDGINEIKEMNLKLPKLVQDNYFILDGLVYIPLMFLERVLIDHIVQRKPDGKIHTKKTHIVLTLMPTLVLFINYHEKFVKIKNKLCTTTQFYNALFFKDKEYLEQLKSKGIIEEILSYEECVSNVLKLLDVNKETWFENNDISLEEFFNEFLIPKHYKGIFNDYYGISDIRSILNITIEYFETDFIVNMSNGKNRRVVLYEYLTQPLHEYYLRMVKEFVNKNEKQNPLKSMNDNVLITTGFNKLMHRGQQFNTSLPYLSPTIHKISQSISIIKENRIPKAWTSCHPSLYGKICPISVSAQGMGANLIFTSDTRINKYGKIEGVDQENLILNKFLSETEDDSILSDITIEVGEDE